jgi:hypothetical protein
MSKDNGIMQNEKSPALRSDGNMALPQVAAAKHESEGIMSWNILKMK